MNGRHALVPTEWLKPHEQFVETRAAQLEHHFRLRQAIDYAIVADERTGTIVDGHHRFEALRRIGALWAPAFLVDYADPRITIHTWRDGEKVPTKADVLDRAARGDLFVPKSTRHDFVRHLDPIDVPLDALLAKDAGGRETFVPATRAAAEG